MDVIYVGQTFTGQYDANGNAIMTGVGPDYATLAPLTLPQAVYAPYPVVVYDATSDGTSELYHLILIYDDSNEPAIITSIETITGYSYFSYPLTSYVS
jgi:hypothetical protein